MEPKLNGPHLKVFISDTLDRIEFHRIYCILQKGRRSYLYSVQ